MMLSEAVKQVGIDEDIEAAFVRLYGRQVKPEQFRRWFQILRQVPKELIEKIQQQAGLSPDAAFRVVYPEYVDIGQFLTAVLDARTASPAQSAVEVESTQDVSSEDSEG